MAAANWPGRIGALRSTLADARLRQLDLVQRVRYVNTYSLSLIWHLAQVVPLPSKFEMQIIKAISSFLWAGNVFRVPLTVMVRPFTAGGLALHHPGVKSRALFTARWLMTSRASDPAFSAAWLAALSELYPDGTPVPAKVGYYKEFRETTSFITVPTAVGKQLPRELYAILLEPLCSAPPRVEAACPTADWRQIWQNISAAPRATRATWFMAVHDIISTNVRLHGLARPTVPSDNCDTCGEQDTLLHRLTECTWPVRKAWQRVAVEVASTAGGRAPADLAIRPDFGPITRRQRLGLVRVVAEHVHRVLTKAQLRRL